ncbi:type VII secretion protein EccE [Amycolatopsis sp. K13G38]|uniref:Type VII secretion protein EccE n=2 Tax=Amycolatopsis acididurans TaxID=2724524 RepID=A0ABX1JD43_9PSEU|nr:type VII secretion protein EccE [Amycolatopsis acididurans]
MLPIRLTQLAAWEAAIVAIPLTFGLVGLPGRLAIGIAALLVVATTSVRVAGRHFAGWTLTWISYRLLQHDDRKLARDPLLVLVPDFRMRQHIDRAGNRYGVVGVGDGWSAVLRVHGEPDVEAVSELLRKACDDAEIPLAGAQLTIRTDGVARAYLVAVRYRPADAPLAALSRGRGELGELRATTRAALGVLGTLAEAGYRASVLEAGELAAELRTSLGGPGPDAVVDDGWHAWSAGTVSHAAFAANADALGAHARGALFTVSSRTLIRTPGAGVREEITVRAAAGHAPPATRDFDVPVVTLYGRQEPAVRRSLPLALTR